MAEDLNALKAQLEQLKKENEILRSKDTKAARPRVRLTKKNQIAVLLDGRRWPITLWPEQWKQLYTDKDRKEQVKALVTRLLGEGKISTAPDASKSSKSSEGK